MLDLSALVFKVDTSELDGALTKVSALEVSVGKLAEASKVFNKASKDTAAAVKDTAAATEQATKKTTDAANKLADGQDQVTEAAKKTNSVLERQTQITEFMAQGFSRGQSSILTTAKAAGALTDELAELSKTLETQRTLMGTDAFDKSMSAMKILANEYKILTDVNQMYNSNLGISIKQMQDLAREKLRLIEASKTEGKTAEQVETSIKNLTNAYVAQATAQNTLNARIKADQQAVKDTANANTYLEKELGRVTYALGQMNEGLNRSSSNALLKFEQALKASGKPLEEQIVLMERYKNSLADLQQKQAKTNTDYISRAVAPQLTDIFVGLSTGQSPLTVLLQQGGQLRDQFSMAGIEADKMGATMRTALTSMLPSIIGVGKALTEMVVGGLVSAGSAVVEFLAKWTGISKVNDIIKGIGDKILPEEMAAKLSSNIDKVSGALTGVLGVAIAGSIVALGVLAIGYKEVIDAQSNLSKALATSGGALGITRDQAVQLAEGMRGVSGTTFDIMKVFEQVAKAGNIGSDSLEMVTKSALDMQRYTGQSIEETVKQFASLEDAPVKALLEVAEKSGLVDSAALKNVISLHQQGDKARATAAAMDALRDANAAMVDEVKSNMSPLEKIWDETIISLKGIKQGFYDAVTSAEGIKVIQNVFYFVARAIATVWDLIKQVIFGIEAVSNLAQAVLTGNFSKIPAIIEYSAGKMERSTAAYNAYVKELEGATTATVKQAEVDKSHNSEVAKALGETAKLREEVMKKRSKMDQEIGEQEKRNAVLEDAKLQKASESAALIDAIRKKYSEKTSQKEALSSYREIADNEISITEAMYNRKVQLLKQNLSFESQALKLALETGQMTRGQYVNAEYALVSRTEAEITAIQSEALDVRAELYRKAVDNEISQYLRAKKENESHKDAAKANEALDKLLQERLANLTRSYEGYAEKIGDANTALANSATLREAKAMAELLAPSRELLKLNKEYTEANEKHNLTVANKIALQNIEAMAFPVDIAAYKARTEELNRYSGVIAKYITDLTAAKQVLDDLNAADDAMTPKGVEKRQAAYTQWLKIKAQLDSVYLDQQTSAEQAAMQARVKFWNDYSKELSKGISDSLVTALFEGGKAGGQKFRDLIIAKLKEPITLVINAVINPIVSSLVSSITSALGLGGSGGSSGSSGLLSLGSNALGLSAAGSAAGTAALATAQSWVGMSGTAAQTSAAMMQAYGAGSMSGIASTIGAYAPYVLAAVAAYKLLSSLDGGETRNGGQYAIAYDGKVTNNRRDESYTYDTQKYNVNDTSGSKVVNGNAYLIEAGGMGDKESDTKSLVKSTADGINSLLKGLGSAVSLTGFWTGFENSGEGRGGVFTGGSLSNGAKFGESGKGSNYAGTLYETTSTTSPDMATAVANWTLDLKQATIQSLQQVSDIPTTIKDMLKDVDAEKLTSDAVDTILNAITAIISGVKSLAATADTLHITQLQKLSFDASASLIKLAGGIDTLNTQITSYFDNFYTASEKTQTIKDNIAASLKTVGITDMPKTREEYRKLAEGQDLSTEAGRKAYAMLMKLASSFASITQSTDDLAKAQSDAAAQAKADAEAAAAQAKKDAQAAKDAAVATAKTAMSTALQVLQNAVDTEKAIYQAQVTTATNAINSLQSLFDAIQSNIDSLYDSVQSTSQMSIASAQKLLRDIIVTGIVPTDTSTVTAAMSTLKTSVTGSVYATKFDEDRAKLLLAAELKDLQGVTGVQLSVAQQQLDAANAQIKRLDDILAQAKKQVDSANGINTSVLSVTDAVKALNQTISDYINAQADAATASKPGVTVTGSTGASSQFVVGGGGSGTGAGTSAGTSSGSSNSAFVTGGGNVTVPTKTTPEGSLFTLVGYFSGDPAGLAKYAKGNGYTIDDVATAMGASHDSVLQYFQQAGVAAFAGGGTSAPGLFVAGEHGKELVATGSARIWNAGQTASMLNDSGSSEAMLAELQALREEVVNLRAETRAVALNTSLTAKVLDRARGTGDALRTTTV